MISRALRWLSKFPILLLAMGPPIVRVANGRSANASLEGSVDVWVLLQIGWYCVAATLALKGVLARGNRKNSEVFYSARSFWTATIAFVVVLCASVIFASSGGRLLTMVYCGMFFAAVVTMFQFVRSATIQRDFCFLKVFQFTRGLGMLLLVFVGVTAILSPSAAGAVQAGFGYRLLGGTLAPVGMLAYMIVAVSLYFVNAELENPRKSAFYITTGLLFVYLAKTRSVYVACFLAFLASCSVGVRRSRTVIVPLFVILASVAVSCFMGPDSVVNFLTRDSESLQDASGRVEIAKWVFERVSSAPFGIGYISGFRTEFRELSGRDLGSSGLVAARIGNAHSSFLEVLVGAGWPGLLLYVFVLWLAWKGLRNTRKWIIGLSPNAISDLYHSQRICRIVLLGFVVLSFTASDQVIPGRASFGYFWFTVAMAVAIRTRKLVLSREQAYIQAAELGKERLQNCLE